ncbi:MAG: hypothetical protein ACPHRO_08440, partial [Nannocystaceae bacterium]
DGGRGSRPAPRPFDPALSSDPACGSREEEFVPFSEPFEPFPLELEPFSLPFFFPLLSLERALGSGRAFPRLDCPAAALPLGEVLAEPETWMVHAEAALTPTRIMNIRRLL